VSLSAPETSLPGPSPVPVLECTGISKTFRSKNRKVVALRDVSLKVMPGAITGLIGPDGAGKTTLMRIVCGLLAPDSGTIKAMGVDVRRDPLSVQAKIGYMPQRFGLYEDLSVQENLSLYADLQGVEARRRPEIFEGLMRMSNLGPFLDRLSGRLSGGMKQKLGLACALLRAPGLLVLDEPTVGVDPVSRRELWAIVTRLVTEKGTGVLVSTSYFDEAERCHEVVLLHEGGLLGIGPPSRFSSRLAGRTFRLEAKDLSPRFLRERVEKNAGVIDAVIQGKGVRVIMDGAEPPVLPEDLAGRVTIKPAPPRFEDGFVQILGARKDSGLTPAQGSGTQKAHRTKAPEDLPVIDVSGLSRRFGSFQAVKGIDFQVARGEIFGILGANGAGKTTTFRMLCGLLPPSGGRATVAGHDLRTAAASARSRIGYMSQRFSLYATLSVAENLDFFARAYGLRGERLAIRKNWAVEEFGLSRVMDSASGLLPLGYKQRLALACSLMHEPEVLFLDEPTSGVDPIARRSFWRRIDDLSHAGVTVLVTTHFMEEAEYCDRLAILAQGEIIALDTPENIKDRCRSPSLPEPTMEDAFISLIEARSPKTREAA